MWNDTKKLILKDLREKLQVEGMEQMTYDDDELVAPGTERGSVYRLATQSVVNGLVASASPGKWLEMEMLCSHTSPIKSEPLGAKSRNLPLVDHSFVQ